ncbi:hypothetical protein CEXT_379611 [Caerostris extrusa]|uniref:Uncharacterized protein n=1 Tax=Caerostris extrusa TaxID=172846 RepID=A0AAV4NTP1_CAEEX|nr:hypothetical protein CEXT_379611 [Caerostris extrusa]
MIVAVGGHFHLPPLWRSGTEGFTLRKRSQTVKLEKAPSPSRSISTCLLTPSFLDSAYKETRELPVDVTPAMIVPIKGPFSLSIRSGDQEQRDSYCEKRGQMVEMKKALLTIPL